MAILSTTIHPVEVMKNVTSANFTSDNVKAFEDHAIFQTYFLAGVSCLILSINEFEDILWNRKIQTLLSRIQTCHTISILITAIFLILRGHCVLKEIAGGETCEILNFCVHYGTMTAFLWISAGLLEMPFSLRKQKTVECGLVYYVAAVWLTPLCIIVFGELLSLWDIPPSADTSTAVSTTPPSCLLGRPAESHQELLLVGLTGLVLGHCAMSAARGVPRLRTTDGRIGVSVIAVILGGVAMISDTMLVQLAPLHHGPPPVVLAALYINALVGTCARVGIDVYHGRMKNIMEEEKLMIAVTEIY